MRILIIYLYNNTILRYNKKNNAEILLPMPIIYHINKNNEIISLKILNNSITINDVNKYLYHLLIGQEELLEQNTEELLRLEFYEGVGKYD